MSWTVILTGSARRDIRRLDPPVASRILDALDRLAITGQGDTQRLRGIPMEHGKRPIGKERGKKLAEVLKVDYHVFL